MKLPDFDSEDFEIGIRTVGGICVGILTNSFCAGILGFIGLRYACFYIRGY